MLRRPINWFHRPPSIEDVFEPPFDLLWDGIIPAKPKQVIGADRFRVAIFPDLRSQGTDPDHTSVYWLEFQFRDNRKWRPMLCLHEGKLDILRDILYEARRFLDEQQNRPLRLPTIKLGDRRFHVDQRMSQLRNVDDPHDFYDIR